MALLLTASSSSIAALKVGDKAPNFSLQDQNNITHTLSDYEGQWVVLYFYPKDDTPGCTTQACDFRDAVKRIIVSKAIVFGLSLDSVASHKLFAEKYNLPFSLLADEKEKYLNCMIRYANSWAMQKEIPLWLTLKEILPKYIYL